VQAGRTDNRKRVERPRANQRRDFISPLSREVIATVNIHRSMTNEHSAGITAQAIDLLVCGSSTSRARGRSPGDRRLGHVVRRVAVGLLRVRLHWYCRRSHGLGIRRKLAQRTQTDLRRGTTLYRKIHRKRQNF